MFFSYNDYGETLKLFSLQHILAALAFAVLPCLLIIIFKNQIRKSMYEKAFRIAIGLLGLGFELILYAWHIIAGGKTDWREIIATTLCGLTLFMGCYSIITLSKKISPVIYYYSYGAALSFIASDISYGYNRFRFYAFFIIHGIILVIAVYLRVINGVVYDKKAYLRSCVILVPVLIASVILNRIYNMNFFYMNYPIMGEIPVYSQIYDYNKYLFSLSVFVSYFILNTVMYGIAKTSKIDKPLVKNSTQN